MNKICGDYIEEFSLELDSSEMSTANTRSIRQRWTNNRLLAQFVGDYFPVLLATGEGGWQRFVNFTNQYLAQLFVYSQSYEASKTNL